MENWKNQWLQILQKPLKEQFEITVNIAKRLPRDRLSVLGHKNVLKFYAYYKQATRGPCQTVKPKIYDVAKRAKWDAWKSLGNMTSNEAMFFYLEDFKHVNILHKYHEFVVKYVVIKNNDRLLSSLSTSKLKKRIITKLV